MDYAHRVCLKAGSHLRSGKVQLNMFFSLDCDECAAEASDGT